MARFSYIPLYVNTKANICVKPTMVLEQDSAQLYLSL